MPGPVSDTTAPPLYWRMRKLANNGHERARELHQAADELEKATWELGAFSAKKIVSAWAKARRIWSECSGESLV